MGKLYFRNRPSKNGTFLSSFIEKKTNIYMTTRLKKTVSVNMFLMVQTFTSQCLCWYEH